MTLETQVKQAAGRREPLAQQLRRGERLAAVQGGVAFGALALTVLLTVHPAAQAQSPGVSLASLAARVAVLKAHASDPGPRPERPDRRCRADGPHR